MMMLLRLDGNLLLSPTARMLKVKLYVKAEVVLLACGRMVNDVCVAGRLRQAYSLAVRGAIQLIMKSKGTVDSARLLGIHVGALGVHRAVSEAVSDRLCRHSDVAW